MKSMKNERGYALLTVLLVMVLVLGVTATFMAGSLNNAKQEQTIDTSNKSVAAAEMGVLYYSTDFERALDLIRKEVTAETNVELNKIADCLKSTNVSSCDTAAKRKTWETNIDNKMKELYVKSILIKINELNKLIVKGDKTESFNTTPSNYLPESLKIENVVYTASELSTLSPTLIAKIITASELDVKMEVKGISSSSPKNLSTVFTIDIPASFLNQQIVNNIEIPTTKVITYADIFKSAAPSQSCMNLLNNNVIQNEAAPYNCKLAGTEKLENLISKINGLTPKSNPKDFLVYVDNFLNSVCNNQVNSNSNCNNINFQGINLVVKATDAEVNNNLNNMKNANLIIDGKLSAGNNMNNLGKNLATGPNQKKQSIVVKELNVDNNIQNMNNTNLVILGTESVPKGELYIKGHIDLQNNSQLCLDIDRISETDLNNISKQINVDNGSKVIYYTSSLTKTFVLKDNKGIPELALTNLYVKKENNYTNFLTACGISMNSSQSISISSPSASETDFEFEVNY